MFAKLSKDGFIPSPPNAHPNAGCQTTVYAVGLLDDTTVGKLKPVYFYLN